MIEGSNEVDEDFNHDMEYTKSQCFAKLWAMAAYNNRINLNADAQLLIDLAIPERNLFKAAQAWDKRPVQYIKVTFNIEDLTS